MSYRTGVIVLAIAGPLSVAGCESATGLESIDAAVHVATVSTDSARIIISNQGPNALAVFPCNIERQRLEAGVWQHEAWLGGECDLAAIETIAPASSWSITVGWPAPSQGASRVGLSVGPLEGTGPVQDRLQRTFSDPIE